MNTNRVFILTKEGRGYSDEGLKAIANDLKVTYNEKNPLMYTMGQDCNSFDYLKKNVKHRNYIAVSLKKGIRYFTEEALDFLLSEMEKDPTENTWEIAKDICDRLDAEKTRK